MRTCGRVKGVTSVPLGTGLIRVIPDGLTLSSVVFAITAVNPHTCTGSGGAARTSGEGVEAAAGKKAAGKKCMGDTATVDTGTVDDMSELSLRRAKNERSLTSSQLALALRSRYEQARRIARPWGIRECREAVQELDEGAGGTAGHVLRKLKAHHSLPIELELELVQGLAVQLREIGFGVALHVADGNAVRCQALELARKRYYAAAREAGRSSTVPRFTEKGVAKFLVDVDEEQQYLVGWTLIPPSMMPGGEAKASQTGRDLFIGVDALDCAGFRGRGQGVLVVRATHDANDHVHPVSVSHMLAAEGDLSVGGHIASEIELLGCDVMNDARKVTIMDGGRSLIGRVSIAMQ